MKRVVLLLVLTLAPTCLGQMVFYEPNDTTNVSLFFYNRDDTTGDPNTSPVLTDYTFYYCKLGAAAEAGVALTALATAATAHTDNYGFHVGGGLVRVDPPDAAFNGVAGDKIAFWLVDGTGDDQIEPIYVQLSPPVNTVLVEGDVPQDSNGVASAVWDAGTASYGSDGSFGKAITDANDAATAAQTAAEKIDTNTELRTLLTGSDTAVATEATVSDAKTAAEAVQALVGDPNNPANTLGADLGDIKAHLDNRLTLAQTADLGTFVDANTPDALRSVVRILDNGTDRADPVIVQADENGYPIAVLTADYDDAKTIGTPVNATISDDIAAVASDANDAKTAAEAAQTAAESVQASIFPTTVAAGTHTTSSFALSSGGTTDGYYARNRWIAVVTDATDSAVSWGWVVGYAGSSKTVQLDKPLPFTPAQNDVVLLMPAPVLPTLR